MAIERDELGFDAPAPLGHVGRLGLEDGHSTGPEVGERLPDFPMLSDLGSHVIRNYGILNDRVGEKNGGVIYGVPYPGVYVTDERGVVVAKFFNDSYSIRPPSH